MSSGLSEFLAKVMFMFIKRLIHLYLSQILLLNLILIGKALLYVVISGRHFSILMFQENGSLIKN
ncbi:hypothetical protein B9Q19_04505 [Enterobacter bugandensis]|nr:hypothetical protein B9Q19_04505 [Enterobacter bugandensis]